MDYGNGLTIRGDCLYCPLAFGLDTYWNCPYDCTYCFCRSLNHTWGQEQRVFSPDALRAKLEAGSSNKNPRTPLAAAMRNRNTIRFGNKTDPFPPEEQQHRATEGALRVLSELKWSLKLETKTVTYLQPEYLKWLEPERCVVTASVSCGLDRDYRAFEPTALPSPEERLRALKTLADQGFQVGVVSEPFMNGWHTVEDWQRLLEACGDYGVRRVNTYHMHLNAFVAKRLNEVPGFDLEAVWRGNEDDQWKPVLGQIIEVSERAGVILGCPDFVNSGRYSEASNTCCGVDVPKPTTFNFIHWKRRGLAAGRLTKIDVETTWDGVGDLEQGRQLFDGLSSEFYGWKDLGWRREGESWIPDSVEPQRFF